MSSDQYFLTKDEIESIINRLHDQSLNDFLHFTKIAKAHELFPLDVIDDQLTVTLGNNRWEIGTCFSSEKIDVDGKNSRKLLSLNCGSFDANANQLRSENRYNELKHKLFAYTDLHSFANIHFQDFPCDANAFEEFNKRGYRGFWIPNLIYSEGSLAKNGNSGLLSLSYFNQENSRTRHYISIHQANFPRFSRYTKRVQDRDLLTVNCSLFQVEISTNSKTIWITTNTYISPFSRGADRLENITNTVRNIRPLSQFQKTLHSLSVCITQINISSSMMLNSLELQD